MTREEMEREVAKEFGHSYREKDGSYSWVFPPPEIVSALVTARLRIKEVLAALAKCGATLDDSRAELAEAKRGKDRKEAFEAGRNYGRANPKDGYPMSESSQEAFAAFLKREGEMTRGFWEE